DTLVNLTSNASRSIPGSGVIDRYVWNFGNNDNAVGKAVVYNYTTPEIYNVTLDIFTTAGETDHAWILVTIDNTPPKAVIELQNETGVLITVGEESTDTDEYVITFNATKSTDTIDGTKKGKIANYFWEFEGASPNTGNGAVSNHSFSHPGTYKYNLTLEDAAGNITILERELKIKDVEPPIPSMKTDPPNRICYIDKYIILNATISTDNSMPDALFEDKKQNLTFTWDLDVYKDKDGDGIANNDIDAEGWEYNFTPIRTGPHLIALWVTDPSGNVGNSTILPPEEWQIDVIGPDLRLAPVHEEINIYIDASKKKPTEGDKIKFTVNITNQNEVTAWDIKVRLLVDGKEKSTKSIKHLDEDDWKQLTFSWEAKGAKKHNITINVTLENNETFEMFWDNNEQKIIIDVKPETPIDAMCVAAIVIIIIIVIVVALYFFRRRRQEAELLSRRREKGKGKKKEKGKGKDKGKKKKSKEKESD
ncbi:MAG: PKD domain-containing protein, partial [Thermoplasmata archaeon]|nr:PKD domain-containing protein [Thermoplasmata archaeon]